MTGRPAGRQPLMAGEKDDNPTRGGATARCCPTPFATDLLSEVLKRTMRRRLSKAFTLRTHLLSEVFVAPHASLALLLLPLGIGAHPLQLVGKAPLQGGLLAGL